MKVAVLMDSFKGSMTSLEAGNAVKKGILSVYPDAEVSVFPLADGGEGTIGSIAPFIGGIEKELTVTGPSGKKISASYFYVPSDQCAYIEMAKTCGLTLLEECEKDPFTTTTYGVGELIRDAVNGGAKTLVICIGGSATNDGGAGMLQALGAKFLDKNGHEISLGCKGLKDLYSVDISSFSYGGIKVIAACDVTNPMCGEDGCSYVYGPQKGATPEACKEMDLILRSYVDICGFDPFEKGTGAAGGMSFALKNFLGAELKSGADIVIDVTGAENAVRECDIVITGEGRMDSQTLNGKAPYKIMELGKRYGKQVIGFCGITGSGYEDLIRCGFTKIVPLIRPTMVTSEALKSLEDTAADLFSGSEIEDT